jgi:hypothetical protein
MDLLTLPLDLLSISELENKPVVGPLRHPLYRTELCKNWQKMGACPYGVRCQVSFVHVLVGFLYSILLFFSVRARKSGITRDCQTYVVQNKSMPLDEEGCPVPLWNAV